MSDIPPKGPQDGTDAASDTRTGRLTHQRRRRNWRRISVVVTSVVVLALVLGIGAYLQLTGNISRVDITRGLGNRPDNSATADSSTNLTALNILVIGSDSRANGESGNGGKSSIEGARSDTNLIVHLSADRKSALVVSIPRDSMTKAPDDCNDPNSTVADGSVRIWNDNYARGREACVIKTIEGLTGIFIDHSITVDFAGFKTMVDALGGVEVCTPVAIDDADAHLKLAAGRHRLNGSQALGYVRVRHTVGDGSDIDRIARQQVFLSSMVQEATQTSLLLRPDKLFRFLNAATRSMTADEGLSIATLTDIATSVRSIGMDKVRFLTVPIEAYPPDPNRVQWAPSADALWEAIRGDRALPGTPEASASASPTSSATTAPTLSVSPDDITVSVTNDSGAQGLAVQAAAALRVQGFSVPELLNGAGDPSKGVVVRYTVGHRAAAQTVAAAFPGAKLAQVSGSTSTISVLLGAGAAKVVEVSNRTGTEPLPDQPITATPASSSTPSFTARSADQDICG